MRDSAGHVPRGPGASRHKDFSSRRGSWLAFSDLRRQDSGSPLAYRWPVWAVVLPAVVAVHYLLFGVVHNLVDTRVCSCYSPDPLFRYIPFNEYWTLVTQPLYLLVATGVILGLIYRAIAYGSHAAPLRLGIAVCVMSAIRMATLLMIPLCRATIPPGSPPPLHSFAMANLHFFSIPWRMFATNDLVFSGHTGLYLILLYVTSTWPKPITIALGVFTLFMVYGLLATREHYTVDILLALPCSYFADSMAIKCLHLAARFGFARADQPLGSYPVAAAH